MNTRISAFSKKNFLEIIRDPLSYIFCIGFPIVMLILMTVIDRSIPAEAGMTIFRIQNLAGGIAVFGLTFVMLFTCLSVAKDRSEAFLIRLYATPMRAGDFILGYLFPATLLGMMQIAITLFASWTISLFTGSRLNLSGLLLTIPSLLPTLVMMIGFGLLFGTLFSQKAAPGFCSVIISLGSFLGGIWFDAEGTGGILLTLCKIFPFYHSVKLARMACALDFSMDFLIHFGITSGYAVVVLVISIICFKVKMRADIG